MASSSANHSAPASSSESRKYDIFLSFRGEDTRKTFVDHLYSALQQNLIRTYKDDETLRQGESISPSLFDAIEESRIVVIILSENYADSSWCLEELEHIMKCKDERELIVIPVFYGVEPSEIRNQKGKFGEGFAKQEVKNFTKAEVWKKRLVDVSNIAGWEQKTVANGHESQFIKRIVDTIMDRLFTSQSGVDDDLVGMKARMQDLEKLLDIESGGVRMVGIWGVGGSGKTTLATSLKMEISKYFHGHCTIENVREETNKHGLKKLQENILSIFKKGVTVQSVAEGKDMIRSMLYSRKVLLLLDDVDTPDQLEALAGNHNWFGSGSRIIITTRDEHLLNAHKVDEIYHARLLSNDEAIRLFDKHAYNEKACLEDYAILSLHVVKYAAGLPLALKVLGSLLSNRDLNGWISTLDRLKNNPDMKIVDKLKISYDGLEPTEKELFLDIVCFWRGRRKDDAMEALEACGYHPGIEIDVLSQKALITISRDGRFDMHDLVQEMGHYIVRGEHPNNPEEHSRLWKQEEIKYICIGNTIVENDKIKAIKCDVRRFGYDHDHTSLVNKMISNMKKLRYLDVTMLYPMEKIKDPTMRDTWNVEGPDFFSNELRYIMWAKYPSRSPFPDSFQPMKLVVLKLQVNFQKELWKGYKYLPHLEVLELRDMKKLLCTPDFDGLPRLQKLILFSCHELREIHHSLGKHASLQYVQVSWCPKLRLFPTIVHMESLNTLIIWDCPKITKFPDIQKNMKSLLQLSLFDIGIEVLPSSIEERCSNLTSLTFSYLEDIRSLEFNFGSLKHLKELRLENLVPLNETRRRSSHNFLCKLRELDFSAYHFKDVKIPSTLLELSNLQKLSLSGNGFSRLDFSLAQLTQLKWLSLWGCKKLIELPELPSSLSVLEANECKSLTTIGHCHKNCMRLRHVTLARGGIISDGDRLLESMLETCTDVENQNMLLSFQGVVVANGFIPRLSVGSRCRMQLPENWCNDFSGFLMCVVFPRFVHNELISMKETVTMSSMDFQNDIAWEESDGDNDEYVTWVWYVSFASLRDTKWWSPTHKALEFQSDSSRGFGVRLVEKKSRSLLKETLTDSSSSSPYPSKLEIEDNSKSGLTIKLTPYPIYLQYSTYVAKLKLERHLK